MKTSKSFLLLAILAALPVLSPSDASAQPRRGSYYAAPPPNAVLPGGFHNRQGGLVFGGSLGIGGMNDELGDIDCGNCSYNPLSGQIEGHIGGFVGPRLALMFEAQANFQQVSEGVFVDEDVFLTQAAGLIAGQYWLAPQFWIKGGIGLANLRLEDRFGGSSRPENGIAVLGAAGFEIFSARRMSIDLQGRLLHGSYDGIDNSVTAGSVGIGVNFY